MVVKELNQIFGGQLWKELIGMITRADLLEVVSSDFQAPSMSELEKASLCIGESSYQTGRVYYHDNAWYWVWIYKDLLEEFRIYI